MTTQYGIIGYPLSHSFSPAYFHRKFAEQGLDASYEAFPLSAISEFPALLAAHPAVRGLSVTIPYKEAVILYLDELDSVAAEVGAVNCISFIDGHAKGYNTDVVGFEQSLVPLLSSQHIAALILGTGGAAKAVAWVLRQLGIDYRFVSRHGQDGHLNYSDLTKDILNNHKLIINTTPLGMYPLINDAPAIPFEHVGSGHLLYDLIYNPEVTRFLQLGIERGAATKNGYEMLHLQAEAAWQIWNNG